MTIQEMIRLLKKTAARVDELEIAIKNMQKPVEIPVEMEQVVRRGRQKKVETTEPEPVATESKAEI